MAPASRVAPIDKVSLAFTIVLAGVLLGEQISWKVGLGTALMIAGALLTVWKKARRFAAPVQPVFGLGCDT